jgi:hypothetical protein
VAVVAVSWPVAAHAQASPPVEPSDQVVLSGDAAVPRGTVVGEVVVFSGSASVAGVVEHDVVVLDGPVTIAGQVGGDVIALHGPIRLLRTAQVTGDVLAGGGLDVADGATVAGAIRHDVAFTLAGPVGVLGSLVVSAAMAASLLVCGLVMLLLAPRGAERAADAARSAPLAAAGWGVLLTVALPLAALALGATVIALPLGLALLLGLGLIWFAGVGASAFALGRLLIHPARSRILALLVGWAIIAAVGLVPVLNVAAWTLAGIFGIGVAIVAVWRVRSGRPAPPEVRPRAGRHRAARKPAAETVGIGTSPLPEADVETGPEGEPKAEVTPEEVTPNAEADVPAEDSPQASR